MLPTAWQAVEYADVPEGGTLLVLGLGPIGDMACRIGQHHGYRVIGVDLVAERLQRGRDRGYEVVDLEAAGRGLGDVVREMTGGRGPDSVVDAVGMEAHGSPVATAVQQAAGLLPDVLARPLFTHAGVDRLGALYSAIDLVRRGGTISLSGVYGGAADPLPLLTMFDKQLTLRMGQANVKRWVPEILPLLTDDDPLGVDTFHTHAVPLADAPRMYEQFQNEGGRLREGAAQAVAGGSTRARSTGSMRRCTSSRDGAGERLDLEQVAGHPEPDHAGADQAGAQLGVVAAHGPAPRRRRGRT